jgi:hypothetical protein
VAIEKSLKLVAEAMETVVVTVEMIAVDAVGIEGTVTEVGTVMAIVDILVVMIVVTTAVIAMVMLRTIHVYLLPLVNKMAQLCVAFLKCFILKLKLQPEK